MFVRDVSGVRTVDRQHNWPCFWLAVRVASQSPSTRVMRAQLRTRMFSRGTRLTLTHTLARTLVARTRTQTSTQLRYTKCTPSAR